MNKAVTAFKWLAWVVEEKLVEEMDARVKWRESLGLVRAALLRAVKERGLGVLKL
jgi:hypothetical protein